MKKHGYIVCSVMKDRYRLALIRYPDGTLSYKFYVSIYKEAVEVPVINSEEEAISYMGVVLLDFIACCEEEKEGAKS